MNAHPPKLPPTESTSTQGQDAEPCVGEEDHAQPDEELEAARKVYHCRPRVWPPTSTATITNGLIRGTSVAVQTRGDESFALPAGVSFTQLAARMFASPEASIAEILFHLPPDL